MKEKFAITIGRQFGSGGREFGRTLAAELEIAYYDKELLTQAADNAGMSREFFEKNDERSPSFLSGLLCFNMGGFPTLNYPGSNSISDDTLYRSQSDIIRELYDRGPCVIVGRTADYVLRDCENVINIFIHAPEEECVKRILRRGEIKDHDKARDKARRTNRLRAAYYNFYTDKQWGDAASYHITIDSSLIPIPQAARIIAGVIREKFAD